MNALWMEREGSVKGREGKQPDIRRSSDSLWSKSSVSLIPATLSKRASNNQEQCNSSSHQRIHLSSNYIREIKKVSKEKQFVSHVLSYDPCSRFSYNHILRRPSHLCTHTCPPSPTRPTLALPPPTLLVCEIGRRLVSCWAQGRRTTCDSLLIKI